MSQSARLNVVMVDAADMLSGLDNWMLERATDLNIIWISKNVLEPVPRHLLPAPLVCVTVADRDPVNFEPILRAASTLGSRLLVAAALPTPQLQERAAVAGVGPVRIINGSGSFATVLQTIREMLGLVQAVTSPGYESVNGKRIRPFSPFEREVIRLHQQGLPPLLIGGQLGQSYDQVKPVLDQIGGMSRLEFQQRLALA